MSRDILYENGILNLKVGDIFKVERESPKPEERMDLGFVGNNIERKKSPDSQSLGYIDDFFYKKTSH